MTKTEYAETLKGERWQALRKEVLHDQPYCDDCGMPRWLASIAYDQDLHVHHKSYANRGTDNEYDDLVPLCRRCHDVETFGRSDLSAPKSAICVLCKKAHWNPYSDRCDYCVRVLSEEAWGLLRYRDISLPSYANDDGTPSGLDLFDLMSHVFQNKMDRARYMRLFVLDHIGQNLVPYYAERVCGLYTTVAEMTLAWLLFTFGTDQILDAVASLEKHLQAPEGEPWPLFPSSTPSNSAQEAI